jgi:hypothetical protein
MRHYLHIAALIAATLLIPVGASANEVEMIVASQEPLLRGHDDSDRQYYKLQIGDTVSYFHQRMIGEAVVERDFKRYQFDVPSGELIEKTVRWRPGLPQSVTPAITQQQAESMVEGDVQRSALYFISADSVIFPVTPVPENPCWIVRSELDDWLVITVIDATTGEDLGRGVPPPYEGFAISGPQHIEECTDPWEQHYSNAYDWFEAMGYTSMWWVFPPTSAVGDYLRTYDLALFYELAHGGSDVFVQGCPEETHASDIESWLGNYANMPFAFVGSCNGLCFTGDNTFAHEFRKGLDSGAAVVGYCGMSTPQCDTCFDYSVDWQDTLFAYLANGFSVQYAYDHANLAYSPCADGNCMRWAGDGYMTLVPKVTRSLCGDAWDGQVGPLEDVSTRPYYLACSLYVPGGHTLTFGYGIVVAHLNNARIKADGTAEVPLGNVWFVREMDETVGMKVGYFGRVRMSNGGTIRLHE